MWLGPGSSHLSSYLSLDILLHSSGIKYQLSSEYLQSRALPLHTMVHTTTNLTSLPRYLTGIRNMSCPEVNAYFIASLQSLKLYIFYISRSSHICILYLGWSSLCHRHGWLLNFQVCYSISERPFLATQSKQILPLLFSVIAQSLFLS